jgi:peptidyl-prolyl cis-trans isomerase A (cyclophilin A)
MRLLLALLASLSLVAGPGPKKPRVKFTTTVGMFVVELDPEAAPKTVENFLGYVRSGFYKGTIFHRVMPTFMVQGGGFTEDLQEKRGTSPSVVNEAKLAKEKGLRNTRGTIAMARMWMPDSAKNQFFINVVDNTKKLDYPGQDGAGYCPFGRVVQGMEVIDKIRRGKTTTKGELANVPVRPIVIKDAVAL